MSLPAIFFVAPWLVGEALGAIIARENGKMEGLAGDLGVVGGSGARGICG
jgi:hypothetical protein